MVVIGTIISPHHHQRASKTIIVSLCYFQSIYSFFLLIPPTLSCVFIIFDFKTNEIVNHLKLSYSLFCFSISHRWLRSFGICLLFGPSYIFFEKNLMFKAIKPIFDKSQLKVSTERIGSYCLRKLVSSASEVPVARTYICMVCCGVHCGRESETKLSLCSLPKARKDLEGERTLKLE